MAFDKTNRGFAGALGFAFTAIGGAFLLLSILALFIPAIRNVGVPTSIGFMALAATLTILGLVLRRRAPTKPTPGATV
jgi:hypothetical protein